MVVAWLRGQGSWGTEHHFMNEQNEHPELEPAVLAVRGPDMAELAEHLVATAGERGIALTGEGGLLAALTKQVLQSALEAEMSVHLGYDRHDPVGRNRGNSRNGSTPKTVTTEVGKVTVQVPRDREGSFEPRIIAKHQRRLLGFDEQVISLYAKGMTTGDIAAHLAEVYDTDISRDTVSTVTAKVAEDLKAWQARPLDRIYPVIIIDAIILKIRKETSLIGPFTWRWGSISTGSVTCSGSGSVPPVGRARNSG